MPRQPPKMPDQEGAITFTMVKFEMKGSDTSLQKGVDTIKAALVQSGFIQVPEQRQLRGPMQARSPTNGQDTGETETVDEENLTDVEEEVADAAPATVPRPSTPRARPKAKNYTAVDDPGFSSVTPTFKDFATEKNPTTDSKKFCVIAYWFKNHLKKPNVSPELFYTAFREMKWAVPTDIAATVRELRSARDQRLTKGNEPNTSIISHLGENAVDELKATDV